MRTRRQERAIAAEAEPESEATTSSPPPPPTAPASDDAEDASSTSPTVVTITKIEGPTVKHTDRSTQSKLPKPIRFPLVAILSLSLSALGYSLAWPYTKGVLAEHVRVPDTREEIGALVGWRIFELALGWFSNYDGYDLTALNLLSHGPPLYLLFAHYDVHPGALLLTLAIETVAAYVPFRLLRPLSTAHANPNAVPNAEIVSDRSITLLTTLLAGAIYSVTLVLAYATYLPTYLIVHFVDLPSLVRAHESTYVGLLPVTLALGFAAQVFIFAPAEATGRTDEDARNEQFDPVVATLGETIRWNVWGWTSQTKVVVKRTALLMLVTGTNTFLQTYLTVRGVEAEGAAAWSGVWVLAAAMTGLGLGAVGSV
ncbi:hypothetical protein F4809DRAFT_620206 [Biscogniauxia mediterranea]|nr:hypothetical protein F4809DRAFT_620206 [Biscogniauxia mediterranea]